MPATLGEHPGAAAGCPDAGRFGQTPGVEARRTAPHAAGPAKHSRACT
jgi:hypothetical protein